MTTAYLCILIASFLPIACTGIAKAGARGYDNASPREWLAKQEGYRKRANAAQANSWEALPFFAVAVVIAHQLRAPQSRIDTLAVSFVAARLIYIVTYLANLSTLRTAVFGVGFALSVAIFFSSMW